MSFSSTVKDEICRVELNESCCLLSELVAVARISGNDGFAGKDRPEVHIATENAAFARRVFSIIRKLFGFCPEISVKKGKKLKKHQSYHIMIRDTSSAAQLFDSISKKKLLKKACCRKSYLRGAFLAGGSVTDPEKNYHMEITGHNLKTVIELVKLMGSFKLNARVVKRKNSYVAYLKGGEDVVDFLNIIGAHRALLELENIRILKEMRNHVNRIVNCETANLEKTVNASVRQIQNIEYIRDKIGFDKLPANLKDIAELRLAYSEASLMELGQMLYPSLGKSGVNHRLRKLEAIAERERRAENSGESR